MIGEGKQGHLQFTSRRRRGEGERKQRMTGERSETGTEEERINNPVTTLKLIFRTFWGYLRLSPNLFCSKCIFVNPPSPTPPCKLSPASSPQFPAFSTNQSLQGVLGGPRILTGLWSGRKRLNNFNNTHSTIFFSHSPFIFPLFPASVWDVISLSGGSVWWCFWHCCLMGAWWFSIVTSVCSFFCCF